MDDDDEDRREEYAGGVHVVTNDVFPGVPGVIVGRFYGWYSRGPVRSLDLLDGMLEEGAHGMGCRTEYV